MEWLLMGVSLAVGLIGGALLYRAREGRRAVTDRNGAEGRDRFSIAELPAASRLTTATTASLQVSPEATLAALVDVSALKAPPSPERYEIISAPPQMRSVIEPLIGHGLSATGAASVASSGMYSLRFAPEVTQGINGGLLKLMEAGGGGVRGTAVDLTGKFAGQGVLHPVHALKVASAALAIWQIAAFVTAQKFLVDIDVRLGEIEKGVQRLQDWLENDRIGHLDAAWKYARETAHYLSSGAYDEDEVELRVHRLEHYDGECHAAMRSALRDLDQLRDDVVLRAREASVPSGLEKGEAHIEAMCRRWIAQAQVVYFAAHTRAVLAQLRCALPASREISEARLRSLEKEMDEATDTRDELSSALLALVTSVKGGRFTKDDRETAARQQLSLQVHEVEDAQRQIDENLRSTIDKALTVMRQLEARSSHGMELLVDVRGTEMRLWQERATGLAG